MQSFAEEGSKEKRCICKNLWRKGELVLLALLRGWVMLWAYFW